ncbi:MAG TPA: Flp pilus assembly protein CpaB [Nevskiaceae bacterium]|nr:Flp pilus assembly protein CpaB [Nevskiaceae bacterium]
MSSTALKLIAVGMVLLAVILGAVTINVYRQNAQKAQDAAVKAEQEKNSPQVVAMVAVKPLAAYKAIDRESVALVPVAVAPTQYFTSFDEVVGRTPLVDIDAGAPITSRYFKEGNVLARVIPPGYQAVSLEINDVIAVGGFVRPGDIVDVLLFLRAGSGVDQPQSRVLLKEARLLAYEDRIIDRPQGLRDDEKTGTQQQRRTRTAVLAVPEAETTRVMLGASLGEVRLALRSQGDAETAKAEAGVPLSNETVAAREAQKVPDQTVTASQLSAVREAPAVAQKKAAPAPSVEVFRGSEHENISRN